MPAGVPGGAISIKDVEFALWADAQRKDKTHNHTLSPKYSCTSTQLIGNILYAWHGMLGYCQKDKFEKHLQAIKSGDITDDGLSVRRELFCHYGNGDWKNKAIISVSTILPHCSTFCKMKMNALFKSPVLAHVLLRVHKTGKYFPDASEIANCDRCGMCMEHFGAQGRSAC